MFSQHEISEAEHRRWYEDSADNPDKHLTIFEVDEKAIGFVQFTLLVGKAAADWGFYLAPETPNGTGKRLGKTALSFAFTVLDLHKVCGQALTYNAASILFHQRLGFQQEGCLREQYFDGKAFHDVLHFGLLKSEWHVND